MLYTIGTSTRSAEEFFAELDRRNVQLLVDVRSRPWSRSEWACRTAMEIACTRHGIRYAWTGRLLGGLNALPTTSRDFQVAAEAVLDATDAGHVAMFCAEGDPAHCHRSWKVAAHLLLAHGVVTHNILRNGQEEPVDYTLLRTAPADLPQCLRREVLSLIGSPLLL